jgi:thioredoxin 1
MSSRGTDKNSESRLTNLQNKKSGAGSKPATGSKPPVRNNPQYKGNPIKKSVQPTTKEIWWKMNKKLVIGLSIIGFFVIAIIVGIIVGDSANSDENPSGSSNKPTLLDIGSTSCIPCQELQPVLADLRSDYGSQVDVKFYDAWKTTEGANKANQYSVTSIPTLIFLNANGREVARMTGYHSYDEIVAKYRELGWI